MTPRDTFKEPEVVVCCVEGNFELDQEGCTFRPFEHDFAQCRIPGAIDFGPQLRAVERSESPLLAHMSRVEPCILVSVLLPGVAPENGEDVGEDFGRESRDGNDDVICAFQCPYFAIQPLYFILKVKANLADFLLVHSVVVFTGVGFFNNFLGWLGRKQEDRLSS